MTNFEYFDGMTDYDKGYHDGYVVGDINLDYNGNADYMRGLVDGAWQWLDEVDADFDATVYEMDVPPDED